jgi:hypothetical protein
MLRLWQTTRDGDLVWWASLESPHTAERHSFVDLESLFDFLRQRIARHSATFVVHLQVEYLEQAPPVWRGEVEHVQSGRRRTFGTPDELLDFLRQQAQNPGMLRPPAGE